MSNTKLAKAHAYKVYIEGGLHDEVKTLRKAETLKRKFEAEGWNVKIVAEYETYIGNVGVEL